MLNSIPGYLIRGENENLLCPLVQAWDIVQQSAQGEKMRALRRITTPKDPWFGYEDVSEKALGNALACSFTNNVLRPGKDTRVTGFKEVRWHKDPKLFPIMLTFLCEFFPKTRFIFNIRDHNQVVRSGWWKNMDEAVVREELSEAESLYSDFSNAHPKQCITLQYNDYITGAPAWRHLFEFLEEPFEAEKVTGILDQKLEHMKARKAHINPPASSKDP
tara:strand:- start:297 stop:950 length:654 start_codon:yes stop_codon:yes gene_type:complete